jgi:hypothetical protein
VPTPTFDELVQFRKNYIETWNSGDRDGFAANWRQFLRDDDAFVMYDPVGTPPKSGLEECALKPFDLWQPLTVFDIPEETFFICGNEIAWVVVNTFDNNGTPVHGRSIENFTFGEDRSILIRTWYVVPSQSEFLADAFDEYLPDGGPNS